MCNINKKEKEIAMDFLNSSNLIEIIANDSEKLGIINERNASLLAYCVASSRKLENPLATVIRSGSSSGKSKLIEFVKKVIPEEDVKDFTRITKQPFFYTGIKDPYLIQHKFIVIEEGTGAKEANYAVRVLLSEKELSLYTTINKEAVEILLFGPISYMESSTSDVYNEETENRLLEIALNESIAQNVAVQEYKKKRAASGWNENEEKSIIQRHHTAQRLLKKVDVIIPYAEEIKFPFTQIRTRRDFQKFLDLISVVAYLHQFQREAKSINGSDYIEANLSDYEIAYNLIESIIKRSLDELKPKSRELFQIIKDIVDDKAKKTKRDSSDINFTRNDIIKDSEWTLRQARTYIGDLVNSEYIQVLSGNKGKEYVYKLNKSDTIDNSKFNITTPKKLREKVKEK